MPIGNYLSQYFANLYLTYFDHWIKEELKVKYYFRYADDMVFLSGDKAYLNDLLIKIKLYLNDNLKLKLKANYQVFPVQARGIDFVGYVCFHSHTLMRKSIKQSFCRSVIKQIRRKKIESEELNKKLSSYYGWAKYCNSKHLLKKIMNKFSDLNIQATSNIFIGDKIKISKLLNREIKVLKFKLDDSKFSKNKSGKCLCLQLEINGEKNILFTGSDVLISQIEQVQEESFPFLTTIKQEGEHFEFS